MRIIDSSIITETVEKMCIEANCHISEDIKNALLRAKETEKSDVGKSIILDLIENARIASNKEMPICQDTGMAVFFVKIGKEVFVEGDNLSCAINKVVIF